MTKGSRGWKSVWLENERRNGCYRIRLKKTVAGKRKREDFDMIAFLNWLDGVLLGRAADRADDSDRSVLLPFVLDFPVPSLWLDYEENRRKTVPERRQKQVKERVCFPRLRRFRPPIGGTVGFGNIAGVATAVAAGGPGAIMWMWLSSLLGMILKQVEGYPRLLLPSHQRKGGVLRRSDLPWSADLARSATGASCG